MKRLFGLLLLILCLPAAVFRAQAQSIYEPYSFTTLAGNPPGSIDGTGSAARFSAPFGLAIDSSGNIYVADSDNNTIRKVTATGVVTTLAGSGGVEGTTDGTGSAARFSGPKGVVLDSSGNIYVADSINDTIRKITVDGVVSTLAGMAGMPGSADGAGTAAQFSSPVGVTVDSNGDLYVADRGNHTIRKVTADGLVTTFAGVAGKKGYGDGPADVARFHSPSGVAIDSGGTIYVADSGNETIRTITSDRVVGTLAGSPGVPGSDDGAGANAKFYAPMGVTVDSGGIIYVADSLDQTIRKIDPTGFVTTLAGSAQLPGSDDGLAGTARFNIPRGVVAGSGGTVYVGDSHNNAIRKIATAGVVSTLAGLSGTGTANGVGSMVRFNFPNSPAVDHAGNIYVADVNNHTIRKISPTGEVTTLAGLAGAPGYTDGVGAKARFNFPRGIAVDGDGNLYVSERGNDTIRKITAVGVVSTVAGLALQPGNMDGQGTAARFNAPYGVALDGGRNIYVADEGNFTIRKITPDGLVTTLAGTGSQGAADGPAGTAQFGDPAGIAVDSAGIVYVGDGKNNTVRKVAAGLVSTLAGMAGGPGDYIDAVGSAARFNLVEGIAVDSSGFLYVADTGNSIIRKITPGAAVSTLGGLTGRMGGEDGVGSDARFDAARGIAVSSSGILYVGDSVNNTVRVGVVARPVIKSPLVAQAVVGQEFVYQFQAEGANALGATSLASGLLFESTLAAITGSPNTAGVFEVQLSATNPVGTTNATLTIAVQSPPVMESDVVSGTGATGSIGQPFTYQLRASGISASGKVSAAGLPSGLTVDPATGVISGILPDKLVVDDSDFILAVPAQNGSSLVTLTVTNGGTKTTSTLQLAFTSDPAVPVIISPTEAALTPGQPFSYHIVAPTTTDPDTGPTVYSKDGALPGGLEFDTSKGIISGSYQVGDAELMGGKGARRVEKRLSGGTPNLIGSVQLFARNKRGTATIPLLFTEAPPGTSNISSRLAVGTGEDVFIAGFIITGNAPKKVLLRAIGPSLQVNGMAVQGSLQDPMLELHDSTGLVIDANDNWGDIQGLQILGTGVQPSDPRESALLVTLDPGSYTAVVSGKDGGSGLGLVEAYDLGTASLDITEETQLANLSTRGKVAPGDGVMIGGFIVEGDDSSNVLVRALGPELNAKGITGALQDTTLELYDSNAALIAFNDNWATDQEGMILFTNVAPTDPRESAIEATLDPGSYTAIVHGKNGTSGVALMEVYVLP